MNCYDSAEINKRLLDMLTYASLNIEFYRDYFISTTGDYYNLPIIDKNILIRDYNRFVGRKHNFSVISNWTSGTTGQPMRIQWGQSDYQKSYYALWKRRKQWYNIMPYDRCLTFYSTTANEFVDQTDNIIMQNNVMQIRKDAVYRNGIFSYWDYVNEFDPHWVLGPPSIIVELARYMESTGKCLKSLRYIELNGETVQTHTFVFLKNFFRVAISNLYGSIEFNGIALSCPQGHLHVLHENVFVESYNKELLITSLTNKHMPLIRYNIGDNGELDFIHCDCGCEGTIITNLHGRKSELIFLNNGHIPQAIFSRIIEEINQLTIKVIQYQVVVYNNQRIVCLNLLVNEQYSKELLCQKQYYIHKLRELTNEAIDVKYNIAVFTQSQNFTRLATKKIQEIVYL